MHASAWDFIIGSMEYVYQVSAHGIGMVVSLRLEGSSGRGQGQIFTELVPKGGLSCSKISKNLPLASARTTL